jgi:hypothetical protein
MNGLQFVLFTNVNEVVNQGHNIFFQKSSRLFKTDGAREVTGRKCRRPIEDSTWRAEFVYPWTKSKRKGAEYRAG